MGKSWLACVSVACLSPGKDKNNQRAEKEKKKWFGRQKSRESIEYLLEETTPIDHLSSPLTLTLPSPPPPLPDIAPQPLLPPPSPPPPAPASTTSYVDSKEAKNRQAVALASAIAAEAAVVAAHAAAEVMRLTITTSSTNQLVESKEEAAAIKIQNAYRCYKARHTLRVLRGMARIKTLLQGTYVKRQMNTMLSSMQNFTRLQTQIQGRKNRLFEENKSRHRLILQKVHQKEHNQNQNLVIAGDFDSSNKSKEQIEAKSVHRKEASVRRERALAYAYSHQQTWRSSTKLSQETLMDPNTPQWGWSWLERWMASPLWDPQSNDDLTSFENPLKRENSIKTSPAKTKTRKAASQSSIQCPLNNSSKSKKSEWTNPRHSIGGGSSKTIKEDESIGSPLPHISSLSSTQTVKPKGKVSVETRSNLSNTQPEKAKTSVGTTRNLENTQALKKSKSSMGTTGNLVNKEAVKSKVDVGTTSNIGLQKKKVLSDKQKPPQMLLPKKRLSSSTSLGKTKKLSDPERTTTDAANGEKKRRNGGSS